MREEGRRVRELEAEDSGAFPVFIGGEGGEEDEGALEKQLVNTLP